VSHPDSHELTDWPTYGPQDVRIADRVDELAALGLRLAEIEAIILSALDQRLEKMAQASPL